MVLERLVSSSTDTNPVDLGRLDWTPKHEHVTLETPRWIMRRTAYGLMIGTWFTSDAVGRETGWQKLP